MLKLMKYEFRKQLMSKIIIAITLAILELIFVYGLLSENNSILTTSVIMLVFLTFGVMFYVSFEAIFTFSNDLRTKHSYMLFLTPNSAYKIVGAKVLSSIIQIFLVWIAFAMVAFLDIFIYTVKYLNLGRAFEMIGQILQDFLSLDINMTDLILVLISIVVSWIATVITGFLAITLSATFLANFKARWLISAAVFFLINYVVYKLRDFIVPDTNALYNYSNVILTCVFMTCVTAIVYVVTAVMLDKKVSL